MYTNVEQNSYSNVQLKLETITAARIEFKHSKLKGGALLHTHEDG
jgi:hypothetical protein